MASDTLSSYDFAGKAEVQLLPTAAHEVSCVLLYTIESPSGTNESVCLGQIDEDFENLPPVPVLVRLGTKVSDTHTSNIGFRVFLQQDAGKAHSTGHLEDNYRIFSFSFVHVGNAVDIHPASELDRIHLIRGAAPRYYPGSELYCLNFIADGVGKTFLPSQHGDELRSSSVTVQNAVKQLQPLIRVKQASLFFHADTVLLEHLDQAIERNGMGIEAPSWKDSLPESAVPTWPADSQPRMIAGSTDLINDLYTALRLVPLGDGPGTSLEDRPQAKKFAAFVRTMYPSTKEPESAGKVYPIMLNVGNGLCLDLPFGASMYNQENVLTGIKVLLRLVSMGVPVSAIGIVAFYPAQAQAYQKELAQCHRRSPPTGYDKIAVITLEGWVGKEIEIAIVDMVRTRNASGNLGWLSQNRRLKLALTLHRDGLIILGDRKCTANSHGEIISTKLEKVLQWFDVNGRIVNVSREGLPVANEGQLPDVKSEPAITNKGKAYPYTPSSWTQPATARMYLGAPGLEESITHSGLDKNGNAPDYAGAPIGVKEVRKDIISARQSFERQFGPSTMQQLSAYNTATASKKYVGGATTPEDLDAKASHPEVQDSFARQGLVRKGRGAFLYDGPESPEESSQRQQFDGLEHNEEKKR